VSAIDFGRFDVLTFDCYGTLIDWERGILNALQPILAWHDVEPTEDELLERFARHEAALESREYLAYREILARTAEAICGDFGVAATRDDLAEFSLAVADWPAFPDSAPALRRLARRFRLGVITNCDDDLFARSNRRLGVAFDWVVTAQQARSYKPSEANFELAFATIGVPRERIIHVAQSLFHDHVPARRLGLTTVWVDRRQGKSGSGATPKAVAEPDLTVPDMLTLAEVALS
jgi:2-haloacid dehalogenase